jgi:hypothetical protein
MFLLILLLIVAIATVASWIIVDGVTAAGTVAEPFITWNLYVAPAISALSTALILLFVDRRFRSSDKKDDRIASLLAEKEERKEAHIKEWRDTYTKKIDCVKATVDEIREDMHQKVPFTICDEREGEIKQMLRDVEIRLRAGKM